MVNQRARRADPREHGRQAARSKRDRPGGQASWATNSATSAPPSGVAEGGEGGWGSEGGRAERARGVLLASQYGSAQVGQGGEIVALGGNERRVYRVAVPGGHDARAEAEEFGHRGGPVQRVGVGEVGVGALLDEIPGEEHTGVG